ncbi:anhydro-N-acetylmuramic acid kinase [Limimaricola pyoseonensis]|uniref:Anhydro-N-acetylmuramic acid kinase n=1 Tax=Limimaricola pyoseonensis TaxID=521013 RepID=A0A1G7A4W2_9RHOB|nr:anhydro-N-acetylmuramic acid kinase [Limimaricola pyoseonensis]SDE09879.1 anhydro-N-acetylmuramic acid kinase [Limimaricola pyoseonensis]
MRRIGTSDRVRALGAMSGTSLDGVDAAVIETDGETVFGFGETAYRAYTDAERAVLRAALGRWEGPEVEAAAEVVETAHAEILSRFENIDLVGFHGQTLAHDPRGRGTHQAGSGAILAEALGLPVVWDFRSTDVRFGGEGAPLAPFYHFALAKFAGATGPVAFLNLGGVGNLTLVDPGFARPEAEGALLAFDTGPANAPVNDLMQARRGLALDEGGALAAQGEVADAVVEDFLRHPHFYRMAPKSLDRDAFADLSAAVAELSDADAAATLTACAAASVAAGMEQCPVPPERLLVTGGGRHNPVLMAMIAAGCDCPTEPVEAAGLDGDMLEAQAFGFLAVRVARGLPTSCPGTTGVRAAVGGGTLSRPGELAVALG